MRAVLAGVVAMALASPSPAGALEFKVIDSGSGGKALLVRDAIGKGDESRLRTALDDTRGIDEIWLDSPGGEPEEGMKIGELVRSRGLATRVPKGATCASACNFVFLGGVLRSIDPGARFGVHMFTVSRNDKLLDTVADTIRKKGAEGAKDLIVEVEEFSARLAARQAYYILTMGAKPNLLFPTYGAAADSIHWLTPDEQRTYLVVNVSD